MDLKLFPNLSNFYIRLGGQIFFGILSPSYLQIFSYVVGFQQPNTIAQIASMDFQTEIKCPAEKFFNFFRTKAQPVPSTCPSMIKDV